MIPRYFHQVPLGVVWDRTATAIPNPRWIQMNISMDKYYQNPAPPLPPIWEDSEILDEEAVGETPLY